MEELDVFSDMEAGGLFSFADEVAPPVEEKLPHRGTPYLNQNVGGLAGLINPQISNPAPALPYGISDQEIDEMAELETDYLMSQIAMFTGLAKGGLSEMVFTEQDRMKLAQANANGETNTAEVLELIERFEIKKRLEETSSDEKSRRDFLIKVVKMDFIRQRREGKLKLHNTGYYVRQIIVAEFAKITGHNYKVLSVIGQRIVGFVKSKIA